MRVLVVDDDPGIRESLRSLLEDEGYEVSVAADGEEGLRFVLDNTEPLAVILDLLLPNLTGEDMLAAALEYLDGKARAPVAFIIITANPQLLTPHLRTLMRRYNIPVEYKPFEIGSLLASVAHAHDEIAS